MKISHEVPLCLLDKSWEFNDYDYALVHLFPKYKEYLRFYISSVKSGRHVLLDNSIFELGEAYNPDEYREWVQLLNPTEYIVPDVLDSYEKNIQSITSWFDHSTPPSKPICVTQGSTPEELLKGVVEITRILAKHNVPKPWRIAIPFNSKAYSPLPDLFDWMHGRRRFVDKLIELNIINEHTHIHLLGCSLPQEFSHYRGPRYSQITTIDTSNPVVLGIEGHRYKVWGLDWKPTTKLVDYMDREEFDVDTVMSNISTFRERFIL